LTFGDCFDQPIDNPPQGTFNLPPNITHLTFGECFDQSLSSLKNLVSLKKLIVCENYKKGVLATDLPKSLKSIMVGSIKYNYV
jgi:hypothetical protein